MANIYNVKNTCLIKIIILIIALIVCQVECLSKNRSTNAVPVLSSEFNYVVSIGEYITKKINDTVVQGVPHISTWNHKCHGIVIHRQWILTTLVCAKAPIKILINVDISITIQKNHNISISGVVPHPHLQMKKDLLFNDVVLIRLNSPGIQYQQAMPVRLARREYPIGLEVELPSWNSKQLSDISKRMIKLSGEIAQPEICLKQYPESGFNLVHFICGPHYRCGSFLGVPIIHKGQSRLEDVVIGIVGSEPKPCKSQNAPVVNIKNYVPWISSTLIKYGDRLIRYWD